MKGLETEEVREAYEKFTRHFHNPQIQENIRNSKEEQYQGEFLIDLFVNVLGYIKNPAPEFNLTTELKNIKDSKKTDGAILNGETALAVIELKGTNTTDLSKVEIQAFGYKNNQPGCNYVITSNFEKLRFYIDNAVDFEEFNLFQLTKERFDILWLCLSADYLLKNTPKKIKDESLTQEENVTKKLYNDYSDFRNEIFDSIQKENPEYDKLTLFKKTQKLLDRFLFIFFAEDRLLLPPNSIRAIVNQWKDLRDKYDEYVPLYDRFKKYFGYMNTGHKGQQHDIFAYNGGLFAPDEILDNIKINDDILSKHTVNLSTYDFESEVSVNILGHIFEHSLNEIETIQSEIEGIKTDQSKTKRKKDGVFYTPKYITKYIVENTIGKLCLEKKTELEIQETEYEKDRKGRQKTTLKKLTQKLDDYRKWLLQLTICDPACGSGAFLNQALEFLIAEHRYIDELQAKLFGVPMILSEVENSILENNLYGVDINEESVEIAKLSLWLRTAQKGRKLTTLNNNIKCGNSLIDDPEIAGEKAFDWQTEFPEIFAKGGFNVVIGNPPYVQLQSMGAMSDILSNCGYESFHKGADLYCLFTEKGYTLLKQGGMQSFIMPNKWMLVAYGKPLRQFLSKTGLRQILNFGDIQFFQEATTYVCVFVIQKAGLNENVQVLSLNRKSYFGDFITEVSANIYDYPATKFGVSEWSIQPYYDAVQLEKMKENGIELKELPVSIYRGILTGYNDAFYIDEEKRQELIKADPKSEELIKPMVRGRDITAYGITGYEYLITTFPALELDIEKYPVIKNHLLSFGYDRLKQTGDKGSRKKTKGEWFEIQDSIAYHAEFSKPKIIYPNMTSVFPFMYDESGILGNQKCFILSATDNSVSLPFLTAVLNSSLAKLWIWYNCPELQGGTREISKVYFEHFPVPKANAEETEKLASLAIKRSELTASLQSVSSKFKRTIQREFSIEKLSAKLENWHETPFNDFLKELVKNKIKLTLEQKSEWEEYFTKQQKESQSIISEIEKADKEIDQMVYKLYGLTETEIKIVEEATA
ncbi:MAG TPA: TaqI-like C-terminal specificity domain-containing protein [Draconibacterium sp.]|nr:TaqI-like C-terminal specificity domain-containing protein [Draconibacterium sp.]